MADQLGLSRRGFLYGTAATAAAATLIGCSAQESSSGPGGGLAEGSGGGKGSASKPLDPPSSFNEAPQLAKLVESGELPPVEERLPKSPYVVPHNWCEIGKYGGAMYNITTETGDASMRQYMYGPGVLRWLNDGLDIGPGVVESWETNEDSSEWVLHIREGLKWSDGEPVTTADVLYWWEDMVLNPVSPAVPDDGAKSGAGTPMKLEARDDVTLVVKFDSPTPLFPGFMCNGTKSDQWFLPKHYLQRWHPKYNKEITDDNWFEDHDERVDYSLHPDRPTLCGWRLTKNLEGRQSIWERNPYYYAIDQKGNQLPYMDSLIFQVVEDERVKLLKIQNGDVDYVHGAFVPIGLPDISGIRESQDRSGLEMTIWDSGSGTGSVFFFNYDHPDEKLRTLIREPRFRQALSVAFNREDAQKSIYFNTGERTTGTYSPKAIEYQSDDGRKVYTGWRDSFVDYDPEKAKQLLDDLGVVDKNGDGFREFPDGGELAIRIDHPADVSKEHLAKNSMLKRDWEAVGIKVLLNPMAPTTFGEKWENGDLMSQSSWEVGDGPDHLTGPWWFVPIEPARWAPLEGQTWMLKGTPDEGKQKDLDPWERTPRWLDPEPGGPVERLWDLFTKARTEIDAVARHKLVWEMIKIHQNEGPFFMGTVANYPQVTLYRKGMKNVPVGDQLAQHGMVNTWAHPTPAAYDPEAYFWDVPEDHTA